MEAAPGGAEVLATPLRGSGRLGARAPAHWQRRDTRGRRAHGLLPPRAGQGRGVGGLREGGDPSECSLARRKPSLVACTACRPPCAVLRFSRRADQTLPDDNPAKRKGRRGKHS